MDANFWREQVKLWRWRVLSNSVVALLWAVNAYLSAPKWSAWICVLIVGIALFAVRQSVTARRMAERALAECSASSRITL